MTWIGSSLKRTICPFEAVAVQCQGSIGNDAAASPEVAVIIAAPQGVDHNTAGGVGGVDELTVA